MKEKYYSNFIEAGKIAKEVRTYGQSLIKEGASYNYIRQRVEQAIIERGAIPAFPAQIALNHVAAHYIVSPSEDIVLLDELVKLDLGICLHGAIADSAVTVDLSGRYQHLIDAAEEALLAAEKAVFVGQKIGEIGKVIEKTIISKGLRPVYNLSGHGLGYFKVHTPPSFPNYDDKSKVLIKPGMTFAIEPFVTDGAGLIYESGKATIFSFVKDVKMSKTAQPLIDKIKSFQGLPFSTHDFINLGLSLTSIEMVLDDLVKKGSINAYPPLLEQKNGMVAQAENSILVDNQGKVFITTR